MYDGRVGVGGVIRRGRIAGALNQEPVATETVKVRCAALDLLPAHAEGEIGGAEAGDLGNVGVKIIVCGHRRQATDPHSLQRPERVGAVIGELDAIA